MVDIDNIRITVVKGLNEYLKVPVIRSNQTNTPPDYPYLSYTITTPESANNGTYGVYSDGKERIPVTQTWSITSQSDNYDESVKLAGKAREWLAHIGRIYLNDNDVIVQSVTNITNRDNMISIEYEYKNGFDCVFYAMSEIDNTIDETIEAVKFN